MTHSFLSDKELLQSLNDKGPIRRGDGFIVGAVKYTDGSAIVEVSATGLSDWIEVPVKMIEAAKRVGTAISKDLRLPVMLIKFREPDDTFAKVAYQFLAQLGAIQSDGATKGGCGCREETDGPDEEVSALKRSAGAITGGFGGVFGQFGVSGGCTFRFDCYTCTRCIPWTGICWESTCCDLVAVDCDVGV